MVKTHKLKITNKDVEYYLFKNGHLKNREFRDFNIDEFNNVIIDIDDEESKRNRRIKSDAFFVYVGITLIRHYDDFKQLFKRELLTEKYNESRK